MNESINFRTLDLNLLRVLDEVLAERSLTRAANNLALTQPAVSNAMRRLRDALGDELVVRTANGMEPTPRALALWPVVRGALGGLQQALAPSGFEPALSKAEFVVAMADATAAELMPPLVNTLETEAPNISLRVWPLTTRDPRRLLDAGQIDLAVGHFPAVIADLGAQAMRGAAATSFEHERLFDGEYVCVMRRGHPLAGGYLSLDAFCDARHLLVSFSGKGHGFVDEALAALGKSRRVALSVNQFFTAGRIVAKSDLLSVMPRHFVRVADPTQDLAVHDLPLDVPPVHVETVWHHRASPNPAHQWLRVQLQAAAQAALLSI
jgi:DNA-binding transcriptional LysR family regulator